MHQSKELQRKIQAYLPLHGTRFAGHFARISFIARFIMALKVPCESALRPTEVPVGHRGYRKGPGSVVRGVTLSTVASALNPKVLPESNEKCIKQFFKVELEGQNASLALLPVKGKLVLTLDQCLKLLSP